MKTKLLLLACLISIAGFGQYWNLGGNSITDCNSSYTLGTTNNAGLEFEVGSYFAGRIEGTWGVPGGNENTSLGILSWNPCAWTGNGNSDYGYYALYYNQTGSANCAYGGLSLWNNIGGDYNTGYGFGTLLSNQYGNLNVAMGNSALHYTTSSNNTGIGSYALYASGTGGNNTSIGIYSLNNSNGDYLSALGANAGSAEGTGSYNTYVGAGANPTTGGFINAAAIGANAITAQSNQMEIGDNNVTTTMGLSNVLPPNPTRLELNTENGTSTFTITSSGTPPIYVGGGGTGWSGLKFDDLTASSSTPGTNPGTGVLTVDNDGNVIYVNGVAGTGTGFDVCGSEPALSGESGINLNNYNLDFEGNNAGTINENDVRIGYSCPTSFVRDVKLAVLQESGTNNSIALGVRNNDASSGTSGSAIPLIGIRSFIPTPSSCASYYNVAGWFEADYDYITCAMEPQYAIFVPQYGGTVDIGYSFSSHYNDPGFLLDVNGYGRTLNGLIPSDTILKKNVTPFNYGIKVIRNLNPVSYHYNGIGGFDTTNRYIGLIAENLMRSEPMGVLSSTIVSDSTTGDTSTIQNIIEEAVIYTAVNAIKELDSTVTVKSTTIDSLRYTLDSLRSAFQSIENCIKKLCPGGRSVIDQGENNGLGEGNSTITNVQEVTLSTSANVPLLYQNMPNPFSVGTKINYYLPEGTIGATLVFYDTYGNQMKTVPLSQTGNGTLNITPDNLTAGIYSYSLIVNNTVIDTKRMILQK